MVAWVAIIEPMDDATPWVYTMTAVVPPGSILAVGAALTLTARAFLRCFELAEAGINKNLGRLSKPLRAKPEPQPRGAKIHGNRPSIKRKQQPVSLPLLID